MFLVSSSVSEFYKIYVGSYGQTIKNMGLGRHLRGKFNSHVKQLETRLYKRRMKNFNNWYFNKS